MPSSEDKPSQENLYRRVGTVERELAAVQTDIAYIRNDLGALKGAIEGVAQSLTQSTKTPWGVLASWASIILAVVVFYSSLNTDPIRKNLGFIRADVQANAEELARRAWDIAADKERLNNAEKYITKLDETLQREMRLLDNRLQTEMRLVQKAADKRTDALEDRLNLIREDTKMLQKDLHAHSLLEGHPFVQTQKVREHTRRIEALENRRSYPSK